MKGLAVIVGIISLVGILHAWSIGDDISSGTDRAPAITADDNYIYIVGYDEAPGSGDYEIRIQKRNKSDGSIVWQRWNNVSSDWDVLYAITNDDNYIYIAGYDYAPGNSQWRIEKRNKSNGSPVWVIQDNISPYDDRAYAIAFDLNYIYITGYSEVTSLDDEIIIQKRSKLDGSVVWVKTFNVSSGSDKLFSITCDDSFIYTAGYDQTPGFQNTQWRIEKRNKSDGSIIWVKQHNISSGYDGVYSVTSDSNYIYIAGYDASPGDYEIRIQKRDKLYGSLVWQRWNNVSLASDVLYAITNDGNYIYIAGYDYAPGNSQWRIEKRNKSNGSPVWTKQMDFSSYDDEAKGITTDGNYIYLCGYDEFPGRWDDEWRIEKRNKSDGSVTGIEEERAASFPTLMQIAPNPFRKSVVISYQLPAKSRADIGIYDATGRLIKSFKTKPGSHRVIWHRDNLPSGVYFCRLTTGGFSITQKLILR